MEQSIAKYKSVLKNNKYTIPAITMVLCLTVTLGIAATVKSLMGSPKEEATIATNSAEAVFYDGKYDTAIAAYTQLQEKDEWPIWNVKIAEIYSIKGEYVKSNEILENAYETRNKIIDTKKEEIDKIDDKDKELTNYIVFTFLMNGEYEKALEYGELFLLEYPNDKQLLDTMFTVYIANGNKDKAKELLIKYTPNDENAGDLATLARLNMLVGDYDKGFDLLKDAWNKDKDEIKVFDVIAQMADYSQGDILNKILKLQKKEPNELAYKMWLAKIYSMSNETAKKASELIDELADEDVGHVNLMRIESNTYENLGDEEKSKAALDEIINKDTNSFIGYNTAAWLNYNNEKYGEAFKDSEKSVVMNRDYADNYGFLIPEILEKQNKNEKAEPYFRTALYREPFNYNIIIKLAEYYWSIMKDSTKALYYYDLASKINPTDAEIYYNMALIQLNNQREDESIVLLKKCISVNSKVAKYHRALGTIYLNKEKNNEAIKEIKNAYDIDKNDILTLNNAACYYVAVEGDIKRGMTNLKAAYDGINEKTSAEDKEIITENYNRVKNLSDAYNKKNGTTLKITDLKSFY